MARHMITARMRPLDPSSAPAVISSLLSSTNPIATAESPAYELRMAMTVGMSAPPMGMMSRTPNTSDSAMMIGKTAGDHPAAGVWGWGTPDGNAVAKSGPMLPI